jgi:hypothetical protein
VVTDSSQTQYVGDPTPSIDSAWHALLDGKLVSYTSHLFLRFVSVDSLQGDISILPQRKRSRHGVIHTSNTITEVLSIQRG